MQPFGLLGGVGGASAFADLTDKATADLPTINTPLTTALAGKVAGAASSTNNAIARFDGATGKLVKNSTATLSDTGTLALLGADSLNTSTALTAQGNTGVGLTVTNANNVGIGTTSPSQKLEVNGNILSKDGGPNGRVLVGAVSTFPGIWVGANTVTPSVTNYTFLGGNVDSMFNAPGGRLYFRISNSNKMVIDADGNIGIGATSPGAKLDVNSDIIRLRTAKTPASATATGNQGDMCWDANYVYVCVATNTWKRSALTTW